MLFTQLKQLKKRMLVLSLLLAALAGQSVFAANQSANTDLIKHNASSGGEGKNIVTLKKPEKFAAKACVTFVDAELKHAKQRFGRARLIKKPAKGCDPLKKACKLTVDWKHGPAGALNYYFKVQWDVKNSGC